MLAALLCLLCLIFPAFITATVTTYPITHSDFPVKLSKGWNVIEDPEAMGGSFTFSKSPNARVDIVLPVGTVAADYVGVQTPHTSSYQYYLDCPTTNTEKSGLAFVPGSHNKALKSAPVVIFQLLNLDPKVQHNLTVMNSQATAPEFNIITFDALVVTIEEGSAMNTSSSTSTTSSTTNAYTSTNATVSFVTTTIYPPASFTASPYGQNQSSSSSSSSIPLSQHTSSSSFPSPNSTTLTPTQSNSNGFVSVNGVSDSGTQNPPGGSTGSPAHGGSGTRTDSLHSPLSHTLPLTPGSTSGPSASDSDGFTIESVSPPPGSEPTAQTSSTSLPSDTPTGDPSGNISSGSNIPPQIIAILSIVGFFCLLLGVLVLLRTRRNQLQCVQRMPGRLLQPDPERGMSEYSDSSHFYFGGQDGSNDSYSDAQQHEVQYTSAPPRSPRASILSSMSGDGSLSSGSSQSMRLEHRTR